MTQQKPRLQLETSYRQIWGNIPHLRDFHITFNDGEKSFTERDELYFSVFLKHSRPSRHHLNVFERITDKGPTLDVTPLSSGGYRPNPYSPLNLYKVSQVEDGIYKGISGNVALSLHFGDAVNNRLEADLIHEWRDGSHPTVLRRFLFDNPPQLRA